MFLRVIVTDIITICVMLDTVIPWNHDIFWDAYHTLKILILLLT